MIEIYNGEPPKHIKDWIIAQHANDTKNPLRFTSCEDGCSMKLIDPMAKSQTWTPSFQYKKNGTSDWVQYNNEEIILDANDYVEFKAIGDNTSKFSSQYNNYTFRFNKKVNASGNIQSLLVENDFENKKDVSQYCYKNMFYGCTSLQTSPDLPATTLADFCYYNMFYGCALQTAPQLPATTLARYCYSYMFERCDLQTAPDLPATTLADFCYSNMFNFCTSLQTAPQLPATTLANSCYSNMFYFCTKFDSVDMKKSMEGVYSISTHGDTTKTVNYVLD